jgi:hypothetical protein
MQFLSASSCFRLANPAHPLLRCPRWVHELEGFIRNHPHSQSPYQRGHLHQYQVWGTCAAALHSTFWLARPHANAWRRADEPSCRAAMRALFLSLLARWCHHDITHILGSFSFRKINPEIL